MNHQHTTPILAASLIVLLFLFIAFSFFTISGTQIALGAIVLLSVIRAFLEKKKIKLTLLDWAFALFLFACVLSSIFSIEPAESFRSLKHLFLIAAVYVVPLNLRSEKAVTWAMDIFIWAATLTAAWGVFTADIFSSERVKSFQSITMTWGAMAAISSLVTAGLALYGPGGKRRAMYLGCFVVQFISLIFSYVRGAWLGFIAGALVLLIWKKKWALGLVVLVILTYILAPAPIKDRIMSVTDPAVHSTQVRLTQWRNSLDIVRDHPVVGVGWVDLKEIHREYAPPGADLSDAAYYIGHFHNNYVMFLVCFGSVGFAVAMFMLFMLFRTEYRIVRSIPPDRRKMAGWVMGSMAALAGFSTNGFFDWTFGDAEPITLIWFTLGLCLAVRRLLETEVFS